MFDAFGVERDDAAFSHVEGDNGAWVADYLIPEVGIPVVGVFNDEDGVGGDSMQFFFVALRCLLRLFVDDDEVLLAEVVADAEELLLLGSVEVLLLIGVVGDALEQDIADEFVCPW